jgi:hypothetical protein
MTFCGLGEHCDGSNCISDLPLGSTCNPDAFENECAVGHCFENTCQKYREVLPGGACSKDSECYYADANGVETAGKCLPTGVCDGKQAGQECTASHQCTLGTYCSPFKPMICKTYGVQGDTCSDDSECSDRFTCIDGKCSAFYSQAKGQSCVVTDHCAPGLYCKSGSCSTALDMDRTTQTCDVAVKDSCGADMQCNCANYTTSDSKATCTPIRGTYAEMPTIQKTAFACLDNKKCGTDMSKTETIKCIEEKCKVEYCTYFTRIAPEMFTEYPSCLLGRMVNNAEHAKLLSTCAAFRPIRGVKATSSASALSLSFTALLVIVAAVLAF